MTKYLLSTYPVRAAVLVRPALKKLVIYRQSLKDTRQDVAHTVGYLHHREEHSP